MSSEKPHMLSGWGNLAVPGVEIFPEDLAHAPAAPISRGLGRSYGDSSLPPASNSTAISTIRADRILHFDRETLSLKAEAGLSLREINRIFLPQGLFVPVTPGTHFVTLGGMVAADVHGKNHHVDGCFGAHVTELTMRVADGSIVKIGPHKERELFLATIGGMGLTGHVLDVEFPLRKIPSTWIHMESEQVPNIDVYIEKLEEAAHSWPMTMGWIDCLAKGRNMGRGILMKGRWASPEEAPAKPAHEPHRLRFPFEAPGFLLGKLSVAAFNEVYFRAHLQSYKTRVVDPYTFFYPLDFVLDWNKMYGRKGFTQYQCVLPKSAGKDAARRFLNLLTSLGGASFLCVIKDCGAESPAYLSFPKPGISIALDIPVRENTQELVDTLNEFVIAEGGRIYLAKDAFTRPEHFAAMEPRLPMFQKIRRQWDPSGKIKSAQSVRMLGDAP